MATCEPACTNSCSGVFERVSVYPKISGGTRVEWDLSSRFTDPAPHTFQLQVGSTGSSSADDWANVGAAAAGVFFLTDSTKRVYGRTQWTHYRVKLTTSRGTYYSRPQGCFGVLDHRNWRLAREILRRELLLLKKGPGGQQGYLIKMRYTGSPCPRCLDYQSSEVRDADCDVCLGTGILRGYYDPIPCIYAALDPGPTGDKRSGERMGMVNEVAATARMLAVPQLTSGDLWVDKDTDLRWVIHDIQNIAEFKGVPLVCKVHLRLAPFSNDTIYGIEIPTMEEDLEYY